MDGGDVARRDAWRCRTRPTRGGSGRGRGGRPPASTRSRSARPTRTGDVQPQHRVPPFPDGATGWHTVAGLRRLIRARVSTRPAGVLRIMGSWSNEPSSVRASPRSCTRSSRSTCAPASRSGSETIAERAGLGVSSATIRNEMAALEELGYLHAPAHQRRPDPHRRRLPPLRRLAARRAAGCATRSAARSRATSPRRSWTSRRS